MSDKKSASRRRASVPNALVDGRTFQQEEVPMARDLAVRAMRALLVALGCFVRLLLDQRSRSFRRAVR